MSFKFSTLVEVGDRAYDLLGNLFPLFNWTVLPEVDPKNGRAGLYVNARFTYGGYPDPVNVCCRAMVSINKCEDMLDPKFNQDLVDAFMTSFKANKVISGGAKSWILSDEGNCNCPVVRLD